MGFRYILDGLNAERALIAAACTGDGHWFLECARNYAGERVVFDRFIGQNQRIHFSLASAYVNIQVVNLMRFEACRGYNAKLEWAVQANKANLLSADASSEAGNALKKQLIQCKVQVFYTFLPMWKPVQDTSFFDV